MYRIRLVIIVIAIVSLIGCNREEKKELEIAAGDIIQKQDGNIFLSLKDAYLLSDDKNPDRNTAEWGFTVNSKGRYEVWLSSLTKDTMNLNYSEPVIIHFEDKRLESQPIGNEIVLNDKMVSKPYFRADSKLGSILIEDTGHYNIQLVSEKVLPGNEKINRGRASTIIRQVILKPQEH